MVAESFLGINLVFPSLPFVQDYWVVFWTLEVLKGLVVLVLYIVNEKLIFSFSNTGLL
jgi:hypothetical protein